MVRRRRKRVKWYVGGGIIAILLFALGDPYGTFRRGDRGPESGSQPDRQAGNNSGTGPPTSPPDAVVTARLASGGPAAGAKHAATPGGESRRPESDPESLRVARLDQTMGIIHRYEQALADDRLADLAVLVDRVLERPIQAPAALAERWQAVRVRADAALDCGERLRGLIRRGEILKAHRLLGPLLQTRTPRWMRDRLDTAAVKFGWPALTRAWQLNSDSTATPVTPLEKLRRVRFLRDGELQEARLWRSGAESVTVRVSGPGGITFPAVPRHAVEPVSPSPQEAISQGFAAARAGDVRGVVLWCCFCHEHDQTAAATKLRALLKAP